MNKKGFVLPFVALLIITFLLLITLAVDLGFWSAAANRAQTTTDRAALSSLELWVRIQANSSFSTLKTDIEDDINALLDRNSNFSEQSNSIIWFDDPEPDQPFIRIEPGRFFPLGAQAELDSSLNRANFTTNFTCDSTTTPTFCRVNGTSRNDSPSLGVSSMRVTGQPYEPIINNFGRIFGFGAIPLNVSSIATNVPPELYFVIDVSGSTVGTNHLRVDTNAFRRSEFVFMPFEHNETYRTDPALSGVSHDEIYDRLEIDRLGLTTDARKHFQSDYYESDGVADTSLLTGYDHNPIHRDYEAGENLPDEIGYDNTQYLGDVLVRDLTINETNYNGPEPMRLILGALENLVEQMGEVNVSGNRVGVLFFDGPRTIPDGNRFIPTTDPLHQRAPFGWSRIFRSMTFGEAMDVLVTNPASIALNDISNNMTLEHADRLVRSGIFPSYNRFTDATWGLVQAYFELIRARAAGARTNQRIIFISNDGIPNCSRRGSIGTARGGFIDTINSDFNFDGNQNAIDGLVNNIQCNSQDIRFYLDSMNNIFQFSQYLGGQIDNIAPKNIALDVILMGGDIDPNLIDIVGCPSSGNSTETQKWARERRLQITSDFTEGCNRNSNSDQCRDAYRFRSPDEPFRLPNSAWLTAAWYTGGNYYPIVKQGTDLNCWNGGLPFNDQATQLQNIMTDLLGSSVSYQLVR